MNKILFRSRILKTYFFSGLTLIVSALIANHFDIELGGEFAPDIQDVTAPILSFGVFLLLYTGSLIYVFLRSRRISYMKSDEIFLDDSFDQFIDRGHSSELIDYYLVAPHYTTFPFKVGEAAMLCVTFLFIMISGSQIASA